MGAFIAAFFLACAVFVVVFMVARGHDDKKEMRQAMGIEKTMVERVYKKSKITELNRQLNAVNGVSFLGFELKDAMDFVMFRMLFTGFLLLTFTILGIYMSQILLIPLALFCGWYLPGYMLKKKLKERQDKILIELPGVIDMMAVAMEAGKTWDQAVEYIIETGHGLVKELLRDAFLKVKSGKGRREAYMAAANKSLSNEMRIFVRTIFQADERGHDIKPILFQQAEAMRMREKNNINQKSNKLGSTLLLPIFIFIIPPIILIYVLPALLNFQVFMK